MTAIVFDTLQCSKRLKESGFTQQQAEAQAEELARIINEQLATKKDLEELAYKLTIRLGSMVAIGVGLIAALIKL